MSKLTTQDCKEFLVKHYKQNNVITNISEWKRIRKYKVDGNYHRDFEHFEIGTIVIKEVNGTLELVSGEASNSPKEKKPSMASLYPGLDDDRGDKLIRGSVEKTLEEFLGDDEEYEHINSDTDDDGYGTEVMAHYYHSDGRDISLFVYKDKSWVITSD
jgi:hypothetical protein